MNPKIDRVAYSPKEFAQLFGKSQSWGYRQIYSGQVASTTENGRTLIPATEVQKILGTAKAKKSKSKGETAPSAPEGSSPKSIRQILIKGTEATHRQSHISLPKQLRKS